MVPDSLAFWAFSWRFRTKNFTTTLRPFNLFYSHFCGISAVIFFEFVVFTAATLYEVIIKSRGCFGCSSSDALRLTVVQGRFLAVLEMTRGGRTVIRGRAFSLLAFPTFSAKRSHFLEKERLRNHHSPPILSAFSHRLTPRGSSMDFFKNKRVSPHFLQI